MNTLPPSNAIEEIDRAIAQLHRVREIFVEKADAMAGWDLCLPIIQPHTLQFHRHFIDGCSKQVEVDPKVIARSLGGKWERSGACWDGTFSGGIHATLHGAEPEPPNPTEVIL